MKRFLTLSLALVFFGALLLTLQRKLIFAPKVSRFADVFTNPDGSACKMPCMFGIRLNETKFEDAVSLLKQHPLTEGIGNPELALSDRPTFRFMISACITIGLDTDEHNTVTHVTLEGHGSSSEPKCPFDVRR